MKINHPKIFIYNQFFCCFCTKKVKTQTLEELAPILLSFTHHKKAKIRINKYAL